MSLRRDPSNSPLNRSEPVLGAYWPSRSSGNANTLPATAPGPHCVDHPMIGWRADKKLVVAAGAVVSANADIGA